MGNQVGQLIVDITVHASLHAVPDHDIGNGFIISMGHAQRVLRIDIHSLPHIRCDHQVLCWPLPLHIHEHDLERHVPHLNTTLLYRGDQKIFLTFPPQHRGKQTNQTPTQDGCSHIMPGAISHHFKINSLFDIRIPESHGRQPFGRHFLKLCHQ